MHIILFMQTIVYAHVTCIYKQLRHLAICHFFPYQALLANPTIFTINHIAKNRSHIKYHKSGSFHVRSYHFLFISISYHISHSLCLARFSYHLGLHQKLYLKKSPSTHPLIGRFMFNYVIDTKLRALACTHY